MKVFFINNFGGGFADEIDIADGTTVSQLFADRMPGSKAADFLIRVDRMPCSADQVLRPGARISMTPCKIEGASRVV